MAMQLSVGADVGKDTEQFCQAQRIWLATDPLLCKLLANGSLENVSMNCSLLERLEDAAMYTSTSLAWDTECVFETLGVHFSVGKHWKRAFFDVARKTILCPMFFLPQSAARAGDGSASTGCVSAAMDEAFGAASFARGGGFTACRRRGGVWRARAGARTRVRKHAPHFGSPVVCASRPR